MGTINFKTVTPITVGTPIYTPGENESAVDSGTLQDAYYSSLLQMTRDTLGMVSSDDYETYDEDYKFFKISIVFGYYEGFYLSIEENDSNYYFIDKADADDTKPQIEKEIEKLAGALKTLVRNGLAVVRPGWCTAELNEKDSISAIEADAVPYWKKELEEYYKEF